MRAMMILAASGLLAACQTTTLMPHNVGYGDCIEGDCSDGQGILYSSDLGLKYKGRWDNGHISNGEYLIHYRGDEYTAKYQNGRPVQGVKFYNQHGNKLDFFNGSWQSYYDPFSGNTIFFPDEGIYHSATGARYIGRFFAIPTRGHLAHWYKENPGSNHPWSYANVVFTGKLEYSQDSEIVVLARKDYPIGTSLVMGEYGTGLVTSDMENIAKLKQFYEKEKREQERYKRLDSQSDLDFTQMFAIAGAVSTVAYGVNSGLTSDSAAELGVGMYKLVSNGDTQQLEVAASNLKFDRSSEELEEQISQDVARIEAQYAAQNSLAYSEYQQGVARSNAAKSQFVNGTISTSPATNRMNSPTNTASSKPNSPAPKRDKGTNQTATTTVVNKPKAKRTKTEIDLIRVESMAYCAQSRKTKKWWCDGPTQRLLLTDHDTLESAVDYVGCKNFTRNRNRSFTSSDHQQSGKMISGTVLYCEGGIESYDRDIAKIYNLAGTLKQLRNTYKCRKNQVKECSSLYERNNGNVQKFREVERSVEY